MADRKSKRENKNKSVSEQLMSPCPLGCHASVFVGENYLVGVRVSERRVILARAVGGSIFVHGGGGRGFVQ